jgi:hypothetical protein
MLDQQADLLIQMDSLEAARDLLQQFTTYSNGGPFWYFASRRPVALFKLGEVEARLGHTDAAIEAYTQFVGLWQDADPELQPRVQRAREEIDRLLDLKTRETQ